MAINILIVDDSSLTRKKIRRIIEMTDVEIGEFLEAENGCKALEILEQSQVGLILADLNMPEMNGAEMIHHIKNNETTKSIPIVVISTESRTSRLKELLAFGIKDYLHKPFSPEDFQKLITKLWNDTTEDIPDLLIASLSHALEATVFSMIMPIEDDMSIPERTICAKIGFTGSKSGTVEIIAGMELCQILAQIFSGLTNTDEKSACDVLQELANITCGLLLPKVVSSTSDLFDITTPTTEICDDSTQWQDFTASNSSAILNVEGYMLATKLELMDG